MSRWYCGYFGYNNPTNTMVRLPRTLCKSWFFLKLFSQASERHTLSLGICILCEYSFISINTLESVMHISSQLTLSEPEKWCMTICFNCFNNWLVSWIVSWYLWGWWSSMGGSRVVHGVTEAGPWGVLLLVSSAYISLNKAWLGLVSFLQNLWQEKN